MARPSNLAQLLIAALAVVGCGGTPDAEGLESGPPPNLVVVVVDTLRFDAVDLDPQGPTPALAALAADGIALEHSFTHAPMTLPAHASLFSSRLPHGTGLVVNGQAVPDEVELLAEWVGGQGYRTLAVASMATLWERRVGEGLDQGFDEFRHVERDYTDGLETAAAVGELLDEAGYEAREAAAAAAREPLMLFVHLADPHEPYRSFADERQSLELTLDGTPIASADPRRAPHLGGTLELEAGEHELVYTESDADFVLRSLYLYELDDSPGIEGPGAAVETPTADGEIPAGQLHSPDPGRRIPVVYHEGARLDSQRRVRVRFELEQPATVALETWVTDHPSQAEAARRYHAEVRLADEAVGRVLDELRARGLYDSSVILFTSDHGEAFGEHLHNGHSQNLFDELLHVPTIVKLPAGEAFAAGRVQLAERGLELVSHVDLAPTMLAALGLAPLPGAVGESLLGPGVTGAAGLGSQPGDPVHFAETHQPEAARDQYCLRDAELKLIFTPDDGRFRLFDLVADPGELEDVFATRGHEREAWQGRLREVAAGWEVGSSEGPETPDLEALGY